MKKHILLLWLFVASFCYSQNEVLFEEATKAYNEGDYELAIENYQHILESGSHSPSLYFNLGNAHYKLKEIAPSIYYYEKALLLDPNDTEIRDNLNYARQMTIDEIEPIPQSAMTRITSRVMNIMTYDQWAYTSIVLMILFVLLYIAFYFFRFADKKRLAFIGSMVCLFLTVMSVTLAVLQYQEYRDTRPAIIFARETAVKEEPNNRSTTLFTLHEGSKVFVEETLEDWKKIRLSDGKNGWIPASDMKALKDF
ncbi:Tetratricopeptide repeat-containing protein [Muriicola jejuensis]|uniref:Tetratricopeptide repeat protein n=1 Tax=Muriicola jejuensis TaxID=504488 RepID=A0A6P0UIV2_9FLAO|nr:tetratricopeptide repeat protein [Muriicola jejuensis]NER10126.1 tetratricopeptide repeat protein [Muriicola jejuensis]SMP02807.1 Tetratricopeptide repeat-containing protein [Muriicola jejuensis]